MLLRPLEEALEFIARTAHLGVEDVRSTSQKGIVYVFVAAGVDEDHRDTIRVLAQAKWPSREILLGHRASFRAFVGHEPQKKTG